MTPLVGRLECLNRLLTDRCGVLRNFAAGQTRRCAGSVGGWAKTRLFHLQEPLFHGEAGARGVSAQVSSGGEDPMAR